jgi:hypothetical protein
MVSLYEVRTEHRWANQLFLSLLFFSFLSYTMVAATQVSAPQIYIREVVQEDIQMKQAIHKVVNAAYRSGKSSTLEVSLV